MVSQVKLREYELGLSFLTKSKLIPIVINTCVVRSISSFPSHNSLHRCTPIFHAQHPTSSADPKLPCSDGGGRRAVVALSGGLIYGFLILMQALPFMSAQSPPAPPPFPCIGPPQQKLQMIYINDGDATGTTSVTVIPAIRSNEANRPQRTRSLDC